MEKRELHHIEPFYGWLSWYNHEMDENSPFHEEEHNLFFFDKSINNIPAHPLWDDFGSESLLVKIQFADYKEGYAILEMFGEWNDLYDNDFKLLSENVLGLLIDAGIDKFILIAENVFHAYLDADDYYAAMQEELGDGWISMLRPREGVKEDMEEYGIDQYFYFNPVIDEIPWRKLKPFQLYFLVQDRMQRMLEMGGD
ncbi:MAG: hypothetical protein AAFY71_19020 [Bacteroidota bacterium]